MGGFLKRINEESNLITLGMAAEQIYNIVFDNSILPIVSYMAVTRVFKGGFKLNLQRQSAVLMVTQFILLLMI